MNTMEQVAEFYSNTIAPHDFANIVYELGNIYNTALVAVEDMASGGIVLQILQHDLSYENMFYLNKSGKMVKPGIKMSVNVRPIVLQGFQSRILNDSIKINSRRLLREIKTFEFNIQSKKAEAAKGKHDDAIMDHFNSTLRKRSDCQGYSSWNQCNRCTYKTSN